MKRSKMIELMTHAHHGHYRSNDGRTTPFDAMDFVLRLMEEEGMLPPKQGRQVTRVGPGWEVEVTEYTNEWEAEDET